MASYGVREWGKNCEKWSACVCDFFRSPKRNSFIDVIALAWHLQQYTYSWVCNCVPSACMAQICNDGNSSSSSSSDGGDNNSQGICSMYDIIKAVIYTIISSFITSHCVATVVPSTATMATASTSTTASSTTHWKQFRCAHTHTVGRRHE